MNKKNGVYVESSAIHLVEKLSKFSEFWSPKIVAQFNDYHLKVAKVQGQFVWHAHLETDEVFIVLKGQLEILFRDGKVSLNEGDLFVVPKGEEHKPSAGTECHIMIIEPAWTVNTGGAGGRLTAPNDTWI
jgi:mannose-6-phosphate isomerase-like protein (cupin superfamily)